MKKFLIFLSILIVSLFALSSSQATTIKYLNFYTSVKIVGYMDTLEPPDGHFATNNTGCPWNDEDELERVGNGNVVGTIKDTNCLVADLSGPLDGRTAWPKTIIYKVYSQTATLSVNLSNDVGNSWSSPTPIKSGKQYLYRLCVVDPVAVNAGITRWQDLTYWPQIPGTNGYGQIVNYTLSITSTVNTTRNVTAYWETGINGGTGNDFDVPYIQRTDRVPCPN